MYLPAAPCETTFVQKISSLMKNNFLLPCSLLLATQLLILPKTVYAQGWMRFITPDSIYGEVVETVQHPGGGVVVVYTAPTASEVYLSHYNANGMLVWQQMLLSPGAAKDLAIGSDGQPMVLVHDQTVNKMVLNHYDWQGNQLGSHLLDEYNSGSTRPQLVPFPGGGFLSDLTYRDNPATPPTKVALCRFDANDSLLWRADIDTLKSVPVMENTGAGVNAQGQSIVGTRIGFGTGAKYYLTAFDAQGDSLWQRTDLVPVTAGALADGNFFYVQQNSPIPGQTGPADIVLRKISPAGTLIWETPCDPNTIFITRRKYLATPDGGVILCGVGSGPVGKTIWVQVFNHEGNLLKFINRELPGYATNDLYVYAIAQAPGGGFYVSGYVDAGSARAFIVKMDADGNIYPQRIWGNITYDADDNCAVAPGETRLEGHKVKIEDLVTGITFYASSDSAGLYFAEVDSTQFLVSAIPPNPYWESCQTDTLLDFSMGSDSIHVDFPLQKAVECPFLEVDISTGLLRRCFNNNYHVRYCNTGTALAEDAYVEVLLDPYLSLVSSSIPGTDLGNQRWRFPVGDVPFGDCGTFTVEVYLDCDSTVLGQTHCVEAHIYPDSFCLQNGLWSGANVEVKGICNPDSVDMVIQNTGVSANSEPLEYVIIEDNIIFREGTFQLPAGDSMVIRVPSNGSTWRLEAEQEPFSPGDPMPSVSVEGCGVNSNGNFSIGFVSQFGENDGNPYVSVDCRENRASYDPNDKEGFPKGVGSEHWIEPGTELEYLIRFQNTGTDTAFTIVVQDTLSEWLDPVSVRTGASSHPYSFRQSGRGNLEFTFAHILLPDSTANEAGSHGFVRFFAKVRPDVPQGTLLHNNAAIYFDFNAPVITNTTAHTVGKNYLISSVKNNPGALPAFTVFPNPASDRVWIQFRGFTSGQSHVELLDTQGRVVVRQTFSGEQALLYAGGLPSGLYLIRVFDGRNWLGNGRLIWQQ